MERFVAVFVTALVVGSALSGAAVTPGGGADSSASTSATATSQSPSVTVTVDGSRVEDGGSHETKGNPEITVEAAVGDNASAGTTLAEVVVQVNGELVESRSVDTRWTTETIRPEYDQGDNVVRVIVTDSADNVAATRFTVFKDSYRPRVVLREPYNTSPRQGIDDGNVTGTNHRFAGGFQDRSAIERVILAYAFGDEAGTIAVRDPGKDVSIPHELGYSAYDSRRNEFRLDVVDELGNTRTHYFSINVTDGERPSVSTRPVPTETTRNRIFVSGEASDDVWIRSVNVTVDPLDRNESATTDDVVGPRTYEYDTSGAGRTGAFNESIHLLRPGTYRVTITATDVANKSASEEYIIERVRRRTDFRPTIDVDEDRTVVTGSDSLFLAGSAFDGVTRRLVVETRTPDGDTVDYQVVHSGSETDRVDFGREVTILDDRTAVIVRAIDPDDNQVIERFFVDGAARETFLDREADGQGESTDGNGSTGDTNDSDVEAYPVVTVTPFQDDRRGTASASVTVERAPAGTVGVPAADGPPVVASTGNVTLDGMDLSVSNETSLTGTVVVRDGVAADLRGPEEARPAGTVSIQHSIPADRVDGLTLDLSVDRSYLDARGVEPANLTVYRSGAGGEWRELETALTGNDTDSVGYTVESPGLSVFSLAPMTPNSTVGDAGNGTLDGNETVAGNETANGTEETGEAQIIVTNVTVNRTAVAVNESVTVNATLRNDGDANGTYTASLQTIQGLNRTQVETRTVGVPAGDERTVRYETAFAEPGNHTVSVNGSQAGPVVVGAAGGGLLSVFAFIPLRLVGLILGGIVGLLVVLTLVRFVLRRVGSGGETGG